MFKESEEVQYDGIFFLKLTGNAWIDPLELKAPKNMWKVSSKGKLSGWDLVKLAFNDVVFT